MDVDEIGAMAMNEPMVRALLFLSISVCSCTSQSDDPIVPAAEEDYYESSGSVFFIPHNELDAVVESAVDGNDVQLQRLIDYYMFSHEPKDRAAEIQLKKWQSLGAERSLKGARYNLMYSASAKAGPDCGKVRAHLNLFDKQSYAVLTGHNAYVRSCIEN